jgi:hypothetical protein
MTSVGVLALHTDLYEIRMAQSYQRLGTTEPATFSVLARPSRARPPRRSSAWAAPQGDYHLIPEFCRQSACSTTRADRSTLP